MADEQDKQGPVDTGVLGGGSVTKVDGDDLTSKDAAATAGEQRPGTENPSGPRSAPNPPSTPSEDDGDEAEEYTPRTDARGRELAPHETAPKPLKD